jgi:hypothetical protein
VHVLRNMVEAVKPGGLVLDLQVIRPNATAEVDGRFVCEVDGDPLFRTADAGPTPSTHTSAPNGSSSRQ